MPAVSQDVFPATVAVLPPDSTFDIAALTSAPVNGGALQINTARVIVSPTRVIIARDGAMGPEVVFDQPVAYGTHYKNPDKQKDSYLTTESGQKIAFRRDSACGCGSRLRSWSPYRHLSSSQDPVE